MLLNWTSLYFLLSVSSINLEKCEKDLARFNKAVVAPSAGLLEDAEIGTADPYWGRLSQALHTTPADRLNDLFMGEHGLTALDIDQIWWAIRTGTLKADKTLDRFMTAIRDFALEHPAIFDRGENVAFELLDAVKKVDQKHGFSGHAGKASMTTEAALARAESLILGQALDESRSKWNKSSKWYDRIFLFFSPHFHRMKKIIQFNQNIRKYMQLIFYADAPIEQVLHQYQDDLTEEERKPLETLITDSPKKLRHARNMIEKVYGRELSSTDPLEVGEVRLSLVGKATDKVPEERAVEKSAREAEQDMDVLDRSIGMSRERRGVGPRPMPEYHDNHLKIRFPQFRRETPELRASYYSFNEATVKDSEYKVRAKWTKYVKFSQRRTRTVTKTRYVNGKSERYTTTESYTVYDTNEYPQTGGFTLDADYNECLDGNIRPSSARITRMLPRATSEFRFGWTFESAWNGDATITWVDKERTSEILEWAKDTRAHEDPIRKYLDQKEAALEKIVDEFPKMYDSHKDLEDTLKALQSLRDEIEKKWDSELKNYKEEDADKVVGRWQKDSPKHFTERNSRLSHRYLHLIKRIEHFREQLRRRHNPLSMEFSLRDYPDAFSKLEKVHNRNRLIQTIAATIGILGAVGTGGYYVYQAHEEAQRNQPSGYYYGR